MHLKYKLDSPFWCKENLINVAVSKLSHLNWQYVAWIDADITFLNRNWINDTIQELRRSHFVQLFRTVIYTDIQSKPFHAAASFGSTYMFNKYEYPTGYEGMLTGLAWACTRWAFEQTQGLLDINIVGGGDKFTALALINKVEDLISELQVYNISEIYFKLLRKKQRLYNWYNLKLSYTQGSIVHHWHGRNVDRKYKERKHILRGFDPQIDLIRNSDDGMLKLSNRGKRMEGKILDYFIQRNDDNENFDVNFSSKF